MSSNNPVDSAAVVRDAPLGESPDTDDEPAPHELQQAEGDEPADDQGPGTDQMGGEAPTG